jgi:hypothetical protein
MKARIENQIRQVIRERIVGNTVLFRGQNRTIKRFDGWWPQPQGFKFIPDFDLATIPISGPIQTNYKSSFWVLVDIDGNQSRKFYIEPLFGPLEISFNGTDYPINYSRASFTEMRVHE